MKEYIFQSHVMEAVTEDVMEAVMEDVTEAIMEVVSRNLKSNDKEGQELKLALLPPPVEDVPIRRRTKAELGFYSPPIADVPTRSMLRAELAEDVPKNLYTKYANFPWGSREFNPDTEFSGGRKAWGTSTNLHTKKNQETYKKLLGPCYHGSGLRTGKGKSNNNKDNKGEKQVAGDDGGKDVLADENEGEYDDEGDNYSEDGEEAN
ncbi:hypothetical protein BGX38DRAFT_1281425 [Terfezia claveryi]|nr:hypothetical protein BGX38DRAFT_1281425 [Terfezia claveryi]